MVENQQYEKECQIVLTAIITRGIINSVATETSTPIQTTVKQFKKILK